MAPDLAPTSKDFEEAAMEPEAVLEEVMDADEGYAGAAPELKVKRGAAPKPADALSPGKTAGRKRDRSEGDDAPAEPASGGESAARTRAWFPESFLWQPIVLTDGDGIASVPMTVPDQLTTWRILGLAHDRAGQQAGATHTFDSRLPVYVDPVIPGWLYAGDVLELPVQVVNTTDESVTAVLLAEGSGALSGGGQVTRPIGPSGSDVVSVRMTAVASGTGQVSAQLRASTDSDRADRELPVLPVGRPVQASRGGTLAGDRAFSLAGPPGADPSTEELTVQVYPGPLAVLQAEMERLQGGARPHNGAYGFALSTRLSTLAASSGVDVDPRAVRSMQMVAWQRIVRASRSPDPGVASDLLSAMVKVSGHELAEGLRPRLVRAVVDGQRGDGTWARTGNGTLQQVLVQTAWAARSLPSTEEGARLRASGAIERYAPQIDDPYTAAVVLASGVATEGVAERLRKILLEGISEASDGERQVSVPADVNNPWGYRPSHQEMLAWTTLALADQDQLKWRLDLAAQLMGRYDARWGFGAGPADTLALEAIAAGLPAIGQSVDVVLTLDGEEAARATLSPSQPRVPATLIAATQGRSAEIGLRADPPVPGLAFVATLESWVPWTGDEQLPGVEVEARLSPLTVGQTGTLNLTLSAPSGEVLTVEHGLPAGALVDEASLGAISSRLQSYDVGSDRLRLVTRPFRAGEVIELSIPVQPAFSGRFSTPPLAISTRNGSEVFLAPIPWSVTSGSGS